MSPRQLLTRATVLACGVATALLVASGGSTATYKPVIGKPVSAPVSPLAGKRFAVAFKVRRSDTGAPLVAGTMICDPSTAGNVIPHVESFKGGTARLFLTVPASAKLLKIKLTIRTQGQSATRVTTYKVAAAPLPTLSIADTSIGEGNTGTATLSFPVRLSAASAQTVSLDYTTADGTATAPADYTVISGTLSFKPGETAKTITVGVVSDMAIEPDETLTVTLSRPVKATIADRSATGTIRNDDTAVPITVGNYKGATEAGNYVAFTVFSDRTLSSLRVNELRCETPRGPAVPPGPLGAFTLTGPFRIAADGSFRAEVSWSGSQPQGWETYGIPDYRYYEWAVEWTNWNIVLTGRFDTPTTAAGTIRGDYEFTWTKADANPALVGQRRPCTSGEKTWSATLQG